MYLLRQGLALRGHDEENSNLIQLLKLRSGDSEYLNEWLKNKKYFSHDIINEICKEIYLVIIRDIVTEVSSRKWFSLIRDETCDESTVEKLCITIRSVDSNYNVFEDVVGLYATSTQNASTIVEAIYDVLVRCGLDMINCRVQEALYTISEEKGGPGIKANGLYEQMKKFDFFLGLKLGHLIFTDAEKLSRVLRSTDCCLQDVFCAAQATIHRFEPIQGDNGLELFYDQVIKESDGLTEQPVLPRPRRPPQRYDININSVNYTSCTNYYRKIYVETLESIINLLLYVIYKPPDGSNDHIGVIIEFCRHDINVEKLKVESFMISDFFKAAINTNQMKIKQITKISTVCEILNTRKIGKEMFQEFDKLIRLYLTIPVTTATAERAFSTLNRVKNALRTSVTQSRLNHCLLAHIYKEKLDKIDPNQIMSKFILSNEKRKTFFGLMF
ncbi:unnamed protein product [Rotaria magnacalcarata]|uniref:HAT C-terminal dimerisation domain-containing protein n=1 Tax=Rotaria magnacalcarata TaxID=392030 RepID=A0A816X0Z1_9BILA|nr:unnamed protein product [Rotaria magnacalcarata]